MAGMLQKSESLIHAEEIGPTKELCPWGLKELDTTEWLSTFDENQKWSACAGLANVNC